MVPSNWQYHEHKDYHRLEIHGFRAIEVDLESSTFQSIVFWACITLNQYQLRDEFPTRENCMQRRKSVFKIVLNPVIVIYLLVLIWLWALKEVERYRHILPSHTARETASFPRFIYSLRNLDLEKVDPFIYLFVCLIVLQRKHNPSINTYTYIYICNYRDTKKKIRIEMNRIELLILRVWEFLLKKIGFPFLFLNSCWLLTKQKSRLLFPVMQIHSENFSVR